MNPADLPPQELKTLLAVMLVGSFFLLAAGSESDLDLQDLGREVAELLGGRGGGSCAAAGKRVRKRTRAERIEGIVVPPDALSRDSISYP